jgi:hypothetical protein
MSNDATLLPDGFDRSDILPDRARRLLGLIAVAMFAVLLGLVSGGAFGGGHARRQTTEGDSATIAITMSLPMLNGIYVEAGIVTESLRV